MGGIAINLFLHASFMVALVFGLFALFFARTKKQWLHLFLAGIIAIIINANWILAPFFGIKNSTSYISTFSPANYEAFITQALQPMNVWFTNIFLYGFWGERFGNHYANVSFLSSFWFIAGIIIFSIAVFGFYRLWIKSQEFKKIKKFLIIFSIIFILSLIFGIGIASPIFRDFTFWMAEYIPFWA